MTPPTSAPFQAKSRPRETVESVVIRFAGDSGDGVQITGQQFTNTSAVFGNDLSTFPDFPAEIRAPAGTIPGVSGYQIQFSAQDIHTPGDQPDVLVAFNPAALMASNPPAAGVAKGPLTRRQVVAEIERARRNGEMDFARQELGPYQPPTAK